MPILNPDLAPAGHSWPDPNHPGEYLWFDFEPETVLSGDGSGDPQTYYLTIADPDGEEIAVICHRTSPDHPIDGQLANLKRLNAQWIVDTLNSTDLPQPEWDEAAGDVAEVLARYGHPSCHTESIRP
jgi:hypothetical protein